MNKITWNEHHYSACWYLLVWPEAKDLPDSASHYCQISVLIHVKTRSSLRILTDTGRCLIGVARMLGIRNAFRRVRYVIITVINPIIPALT